MKFTAALLIGAVAAIDEDIEIEFLKFISEENKSYATKEEYNFRLNIFAGKIKFIREFNSQDEDSHQVGINMFADMTDMEYKKFLGLRPNVSAVRKEAKLDIEVAASIDWRTSGVVNPVKNQGSCGSCWSFSAVAALEGAYAIKTGTLKSFSEQQLVDCSTSFGNAGCNGGWMDQAFEYWETTAAVEEASYPYTG